MSRKTLTRVLPVGAGCATAEEKADQRKRSSSEKLTKRSFVFALVFFEFKKDAFSLVPWAFSEPELRKIPINVFYKRGNYVQTLANCANALFLKQRVTACLPAVPQGTTVTL